MYAGTVMYRTRSTCSTVRDPAACVHVEPYAAMSTMRASVASARASRLRRAMPRRRGRCMLGVHAEPTAALAAARRRGVPVLATAQK